MSDNSIFTTPDDSVLDLTLNAKESKLFNELTLVGKLITQKTINHKAINAILTTTWNLGQNVQITPLDRNMVAYIFQNTHDRDLIVNMGPLTVKGALLYLKPWPFDSTLHEIDFSTTPFWLQIHNLPRNRMNKGNAQKIGNLQVLSYLRSWIYKILPLGNLSRYEW